MARKAHKGKGWIGKKGRAKAGGPKGYHSETPPYSRKAAEAHEEHAPGHRMMASGKRAVKFSNGPHALKAAKARGLGKR